MAREGRACNWGCSDTGNRIMWAAVAATATTGLALMVAGGIGGRHCFELYADCISVYEDTSKCRELSNQECKYNTYAALLASGFVLFFFITPLLMVYICCLARRSEETSVIIVSSTVAPAPQDQGYVTYPGAHPVAYPYPAYGQPYPASPYPVVQPYHGQPYPGPMPAGAYAGQQYLGSSYSPGQYQPAHVMPAAGPPGSSDRPNESNSGQPPLSMYPAGLPGGLPGSSDDRPGAIVASISSVPTPSKVV